jgi:DNA replication protein DnaC
MSECPICNGVGLVRVMSDAGLWVSRACECQEADREERRLAAARIPERYRQYTLDGYETAFRGADQSLSRAHLTARKFVDAYPVDTAGKGLLFTGSIGVGKTHLAVGVLRRLIQEKGCRGLFCDYRELLKNIQNSYNPQVNTTELELLKPVFAAVDPFTYAVHAFKSLLLKNTGFEAISYDLLFLLIFSTVAMTAATALFKRTL